MTAFNLSPEIVVLLALGLVITGLGLWVGQLHGKLKRLSAGKNGQSLEGVLAEFIRKVQETDQTNEEIKRYLAVMDARLRRSVQHVKTLRFNPFRGEGQGSNQSFATAFLDEQGNGVVFSSLYSRDKVSVYAKPIVERQSEFELTDEESAALKN